MFIVSYTSRKDQVINYLSYAVKNIRPVFVVIGLGGSPDNPNRMFCLPIAEAKYPDLFISMLSVSVHRHVGVNS